MPTGLLLKGSCGLSHQSVLVSKLGVAIGNLYNRSKCHCPAVQCKAPILENTTALKLDKDSQQ
jgi:hypothetical protein